MRIVAWKSTLTPLLSNTGPAPAVFLVVTTPRWDERDRFMVRE